MEEEEDDLYGGDQTLNGNGASPAFDAAPTGGDVPMKQEDGQADADEDEDEDEDDSESDIDIITERKDEPPPQSQSFKRVKQEPVRISSSETVPLHRPSQTAPIKSETPGLTKKVSVRDGSKYPEFRTSNLDVNGIPMYDPAGKLITEVDLDADVAQDTKPWRVPGTDPTDFFNYGFDEFTWVQYSLKQNSMREMVGGLKDETKQFEAMLAGPQPGMPAMPPGMDGMNPEMMTAMMSSMQSQGINDPSQLDFSTFMQHMGGMMPGMPGGPSGPGGGFGQNQQQGGQGFNGGFGGQAMQHQGSGQGYGGQSPFPGQQAGSQGYGGGTPQPQQQGNGQQASFDGYSQQQIAMLQQQQGGGGRGRGRGRRW